MWSELGIALSLVFVIEGLLPAISPTLYRRAMASITQLDDRSVRSTGLFMMAIGALLLYFLKH